MWARVPGGSSTFNVFDGTKLGHTTVDGVRTLSVTPGEKFVGTVFEIIATATPASLSMKGAALFTLTDLADDADGADVVGRDRAGLYE